MNRTQLRVLKDALDTAQRRAKYTAHDEEKLWLETWIIPALDAVIGRSVGHVSEFELRSWNNLPLSGRVR